MFDIVPIERYLAQIMLHAQITAVTAEWRIEPIEMMKVLASYFRDIGLFYVTSATEGKILRLSVAMLKSSPEIATLVRKAELQEQDRKKMRNVA